MTPCALCGDTKPLTPDGYCRWRAGCEHRQMVALVDQAAFDADYTYWFEPLACGHTAAEHAQIPGHGFEGPFLVHDDLPADGYDQIRASIRRFMDEYGDPDTP